MRFIWYHHVKAQPEFSASFRGNKRKDDPGEGFEIPKS